MTTKSKTIQDAIGMHQEGYRICYDAGLREGMAKLDQAWAEISALRPYDDSEGSTEFGYSNGLIDALEIIEKLGGMDPQKRGKE